MTVTLACCTFGGRPKGIDKASVAVAALQQRQTRKALNTLMLNASASRQTQLTTASDLEKIAPVVAALRQRQVRKALNTMVLQSTNA